MEEVNVKNHFKLPFTELSCHKVLKKGDHYIEFHPKHIRWFYEAEAEIRDTPDSYEWEKVRVFVCLDIRRTQLKSVELKFITDLELFRIYISVWGSQEDVKFYFKSESNAISMRDIILDYILYKTFLK